MTEITIQDNAQTHRSRDEKGHCGNNGQTLFALYRRPNSKNPPRLSILSTFRLQILGQPKQLPELLEHQLLVSHAQYDLRGYHQVDCVTSNCGSSCPYNGNGNFCKNLVLAVEQAELFAINQADLVTFECTGILFPRVSHTGDYHLQVRFYRENRN